MCQRAIAIEIGKRVACGYKNRSEAHAIFSVGFRRLLAILALIAGVAGGALLLRVGLVAALAIILAFYLAVLLGLAGSLRAGVPRMQP